jgi:hypothetical protein
MKYKKPINPAQDFPVGLSAPSKSAKKNQKRRGKKKNNEDNDEEEIEQTEQIESKQEEKVIVDKVGKINFKNSILINYFRKRWKN